jgi:hypothetical protein
LGLVSDQGYAIDKVYVASDEHVDILDRMDGTFPACGEPESDDLRMDTLPLEDDHVFVKDQDETSNDTDISTPSDMTFPIDSRSELDQQVDETIIPGVVIVNSSSSVVIPAFGERESDDLPMDTLPLEDDHVFPKVQDISTDTPEDTDISTPSDGIFPIYSSCKLDQQVDETIIPGVGIVSNSSSVIILAFHAFLFSRLVPFLDLCQTKVMR